MTVCFAKRIRGYTLLAGIVLGVILVLAFNKAVVITSTDKFCNSCHLHPHSSTTWKQSVHYLTASGSITHCVECHLPPKGEGYLGAKMVTGLRDVYGALFKDSASLNWELKSRPEHAVRFTKDISCISCHQNLYPLELSHDGMDAHLYYERMEGEVSCIKCHINAGHYMEGVTHASNKDFGKKTPPADTIYMEAASPVGFADFTEQIPYSSVTFRMKAIPGGTFTMGSEQADKYAEADEFPAHEVTVDSFYMGVAEVSWNEYMTWYAQTSSEGRTTDIGLLEGIDGLTGATPPYGNPDQGWGMNDRPAITMTHYAARKYCEWLSLVTGKKYRLPTEAEWEYAARAGTQGPYFFGGEVKDYAKVGLKSKLFGVDTAVINSYAFYQENSQGRTAGPAAVRENPFGLKHMLGNVAEFCSDVYKEDAYGEGESRNNPELQTGEGEFVVRGGSFRSDGKDLRVANRDQTRHDAWMKTDPQIPKSLWWYSDSYHVGFRVLCEYK